ncbi:MAG: SDR family NAD(P)-dependent oxidoreductase [Firmicutes bacterium]|nr:SDR family NAD(P)-dependent oxidoreductase [Bacillota bacterium]
MKPVIFNKLENKIAIVTGAGSGIGKAASLLLGAEGVKVAAAARTEADIEKTIREINSAGGEAVGIKVDVRKFESAENMIRIARERYGRIDFLVNCAGVGRFGNVTDFDIKEWEDVIGTNLTGVFNCCKAVLPVMIEQQDGYIINIASLAGKTGLAGRSAYCASKFGVVGFSESLMLEVRSYGIKVSTISPGSVNTGFGRTPYEKDSWKLEAEDVADLIVNLLKTNPKCLISDMEMRALKPEKK